MTKTDHDSLMNECSLIAQHVASAFGVSLIDMMSVRRKSHGVNMVDARRMYFYLARKYTPASYPMIGNAIDKDHTTAMNGYNKAPLNFADASWCSRLRLVSDALGFSHQGS